MSAYSICRSLPVLLKVVREKLYAESPMVLGGATASASAFAGVVSQQEKNQKACVKGQHDCRRCCCAPPHLSVLVDLRSTAVSTAERQEELRSRGDANHSGRFSITPVIIQSCTLQNPPCLRAAKSYHHSSCLITPGRKRKRESGTGTAGQAKQA